MQVLDWEQIKSIRNDLEQFGALRSNPGRFGATRNVIQPIHSARPVSIVVVTNSYRYYCWRCETNESAAMTASSLSSSSPDDEKKILMLLADHTTRTRITEAKLRDTRRVRPVLIVSAVQVGPTLPGIRLISLFPETTTTRRMRQRSSQRSCFRA
jgi:hypothetical protein